MSNSLGNKAWNYILINKAIFVFILLLLSLLFIPVQELIADSLIDEIDKIFSQNLENQEYKSLYYQIRSIFSELEEKNLPSNSLLDKLNEGMAKGIPAPQLLKAIRSEAERIDKAGQLLQKTQFPMLNNKDNQELYNSISLFLLGGLSEESLTYLLSLVKSKKNSVRYFNSLGSTILNIKSVNSLTEKELMPLADALLQSELNPKSYTMLSSLFIKAKLRHLNDQEMLELVLNILANGGGILQIEEELSRRTRKR